MAIRAVHGLRASGCHHADAVVQQAVEAVGALDIHIER
jgi:hypothetical protein